MFRGIGSWFQHDINWIECFPMNGLTMFDRVGAAGGRGVLTGRARRGVLVFLMVLAAFSGPIRGQEALPTPQERMRADLAFLADDAQEGRGAGTKGLDVSAQYLADQFRAMGLKPAAGTEDYFQPFEIPGRPRLAETVALTWTLPEESASGAGVLGETFTPLSVGGSGRFEKAEVVFAGYGITAKDDTLNIHYDDYANLDVKGKVVLILRGEPQQNDPNSKFAGANNTVYATFRHKAVNAFQHEAAAVVLVNNLAGLGDAQDSLIPYNAAGRGSSLPFFMVKREVADSWLNAIGQPSLADLETAIDKEGAPQSRPLPGLTLSGDVTIERPPYKLKNVVAVLEGQGPKAEETVVIGAHYDHLGDGTQGGSRTPNRREIHNGADDNASGTTMVLELARRLAARPDPLPRRVVFILFSGEELGLFGSRHYVENPLYPLENTVFMFNYDMVGRLNDKNELSLLGVGTMAGLAEICQALGTSHGFVIKGTAGASDGFGGSDHQPFYNKSIPVLFAFTGLHSVYHTPDDTLDTINFEGMERIADFMEELTLHLVRRPNRPEFIPTTRRSAPRADTAKAEVGANSTAPQPAPPANDPGPVSGARVYLGTQPDYAQEEGKGVLLSGVTEGSPAEKAGLQAGDLLVGMGDRKIGTLEDFMECLSVHKPGETVEVQIIRDGKPQRLKVVLGTRSAN